MKNLVLFLFLALFVTFSGQSQTTSETNYDLDEAGYIEDSPWKISVGVNAVGSLGTRQPFSRIDEFQFKNPLAIAVEHKWSKYFAIEQDLTLNGYEVKNEIDGGTLKEDYFYISTNTYIKYYFSDALFTLEWLDLYAGAGFGIFSVNELNSSGNLALGGTVWISDKIGIRLQGIGKFAVNAKDRQFDNNHFQYVAQAVFKL